ncbi:MAG: UvrD-helicase domain-containing protein [Myxococcota bacterium]|nr:UvrD-helicase domain-containing protein [Myxococcota bacterium]
MTCLPRRVVVVRDGRRTAESNLGYRLSVPRLRLPDEPMPSDADAQAAALGWERPPIPEGAVDELDVTGLASPSAWERRYVDWLAAQLGAQVAWETAPHPEAPALSAFGEEVRNRLAGATPWPSPLHIPDGVIVRRADSHRLEAREAAFELRQWLANHGGLESSHRALVLLPHSRLLIDVWRRELNAAGVPCRASTASPLGETALASWVLSLARLRGWSTISPRPLSVLREVLEAPFWSKKRNGLVGTGRLRREALCAVRRPQLTLDQWQAHLDALAGAQEKKSEDEVAQRYGAERAQRLRALRSFTDSLAEVLQGGAGLLDRFRQLLFDKDGTTTQPRLAVPEVVHGRFLQKGKDALTPVLGQLGDILAALVAQEAWAGGLHERLEAGDTLTELLQREMDNKACYRRFEPEQGVTVMPCDLYDGRETDFLVLGGLGENGFPAVPAPPTRHEEQWMESLGLFRDDLRGEPATRWIVSELERQIDIARVAVARCRERLVLSFATQGSGTEVVRPGGLLSLLAGGWEDETWAKPEGSLRDCCAADEIPMYLSDARGAREATSFAVHQDARDLLEGLSADDATGALAARLAATERLKNSLEVDRLRTPGREKLKEPQRQGLTAYNGRLPGPATLPEALSASALSLYGECPARYFLSRVLRLEAPSEASAMPAPHEMGTLLHEAFDRAARQVLESANEWRLTHGEKEGAAQALLDDVLCRVKAELSQLTEEFLAHEPTASPAYLRCLAASWGRAIENWLGQHIQPLCPVEKGPVDEDAEVAQRLAAYESGAAELAAMREQLCELEAAHPSFEAKQQTKANWESYAAQLGVTKKAMAEAWAAWKNGVESGEIFGILGQAQSKKVKSVEEALYALEQARSGVEARRMTQFNCHVAATEAPFGGIDGTPPLSLAVGNGRTVPLHGVVDRIDLDAERRAFAIRDYKSGREQSEKSLTDNLADGCGYFFQVLLYLVSVEQLIREGKLETLRDAGAHHVSLEFLKVNRSSVLWRPNDASDYALQGRSATWTELTRAWIGRHAEGLASGRFDHLPMRCPKEGEKAHCDFSTICPYKPGGRELFRKQAPLPIEKLEASEPRASKKIKGSYAELLPLWSAPSSETIEERRAQHERGQRLAVDLERDVLLSAGAGTGKTYNLVQRYAAAIAAGCRPGQIVCATFTRRAAAEMKHRVRRALLSGEAGSDTGPTDVRQDPRQFRNIVLSLSGAPFLTIDSLAGRVLRELLDIESPDAPRRLEGIDEAAAKEEIRDFVTQRLLDELDRDPDLDVLADRIHVGRLSDLLVAVLLAEEPPWVRQATDVEALAARILADWQRALSDIERAVLQELRGLSLGPLEDALEQALLAGEARPETAAGVRRAIAALRTLQGKGDMESHVTWQVAKTVTEAKVVKTHDGEGLFDAWRPFAAWHNSVADKNTAERVLLEAWIGIEDPLTDPLRWADTTARALLVAHRWRETLEQQLEKTGKLRYRDVEQRALHRLESLDDATAAALRERFPIKHLFVDESQDTSGTQVRLIRRLAEVCQARLFWVGDVKQSIYRFRNAEVDVFEDLVAAMPADSRGSLRENWRSGPRLIEAFNRLFGALLPAQCGPNQVVDIGSAMEYGALTWPADKEDLGPQKEIFGSAHQGIELFAEPGRGYLDDSEDDDKKEVEPESDSEEPWELSPGTASLFVRLAEIVIGVRNKNVWEQDKPPYFAVLASTWSKAESYNEALRRLGVRATIQGGRGLLSTPEVANLLFWLEVAAQRSDTAMVGILRGPGLAMSDAGLYCLRQGYGCGELAQPLSFVHSAQTVTLEPEAALQAWGAVAPTLDTQGLREVLAADAEALSVFQRVWDSTFRDAGARPASELFEQLIEQLGLDAYWRNAAEGGRQAMANLSRFVEHVRELETGRGQTPLELHTCLNSAVGDDGLASGGIEAGVDAEVVVTTYWQAKGLEWPVVVLPDLHQTKTSTLCEGLVPERLLAPTQEKGSAREVSILAGCHETPAANPFTASAVKPLEALRNRFRAPAERAELRRLLYVAMTRAKHHVLASGTFTRPKNADAVHALDDSRKRAICLDQAKDWATTLAVCLDLERVKSALKTGSRSVLHETDIEIITVKECPKLISAVGTESRLTGLEPLANPAWVPLRSPQIDWLRPSEGGPETVPEPVGQVKWPTAAPRHETPFGSAAQEGTAFHEMMQRWAFGGVSGHPLTRESAAQAAGNALGEMRLGAIDPAAERLLALFRIAQDLNAPLVRELETAAREKRLFTELPLRFRDEQGRWFDGIIDLAWKDERGWHILDYKTGEAYPTASTGLQDKTLAEHYAQVALYAEGIRRLLPEEKVADFGVWYVACGLVVRWARS